MTENIASLLGEAETAYVLGNISVARQTLYKILSDNPENARANELFAYIVGNENTSTSRQDAVRYLRVASRQDDCSAKCLYELGSILLEDGHELDEALLLFMRAEKLVPLSFEILHDLATVHAKMGREKLALQKYIQASQIKKDSAELLYNIAKLYDNAFDYKNAIIYYDKAIEIAPNFIEAIINRSNNSLALGDYLQALTFANRAYALNPNADYLYGHIVGIKMQICDWVGYGEQITKIIDADLSQEKISTPFNLLSLLDDPILQRKITEMYVNDRYPLNEKLGAIKNEYKNSKIKIGYFSADFGNHPVSLLMAEVFELHDRNQFEVIGFSFGAMTDHPIRSRLMQGFDQFIDVRDRTEFDISSLARELKIDIAIDLGGFTRDSRAGIFSFRAAPIQISYLGYLGTMGASYIDYIIADSELIPVGLEDCYTEKIIYLPSYQANDRKRPVSEKKFSKEELCLPKKGFVFCCFNNSYKISPDVFSSWVRILNAVQGSVLLLYAENELVEKNLKSEATLRGLDSERLIFGKKLSFPDYLSRYQAVDLFLDTFPYNAGTTASDALWSGVPVLTRKGKSFASRMATSILTAIGLPELITENIVEYEYKAIEYALSPSKLRDVQNKLANNYAQCALFDTPRFVFNLEKSYKKVHEAYQNNLPVGHLYP
jgi:predicted O-linked N-acetylglucosamine transferase (SPINDLY family)